MMKKQFRIIKEGYADEYGDIESINYYIEEYHPIFWLFIIPLPIPYWTEIKDMPGEFSGKLKFDTFEEAEIFIKTVLEKNKPRLTTVKTVVKETI